MGPYAGVDYNLLMSTPESTSTHLSWQPSARVDFIPQSKLWIWPLGSLKGLQLGHITPSLVFMHIIARIHNADVERTGWSYFSRGRIHGRIWYKSPPYFSQSTLLTDFTPPKQNWFETCLQCKHCLLETSSLRTLQIMPRNLNEIVRSRIRLP
jgi:hypothetical protein